MNITQAIAVIAQEVGQDAPAADADGRYGWVFDDKLDVDFFAPSQGHMQGLGLLQDWSQRDPWPKDDLVKLLGANKLRLPKASGVLCFDRPRNQLLYTQKILIGQIDEKKLIAEVTEFLDNLEFWYDLANDSSAASIPKPSPFMFRP